MGYEIFRGRTRQADIPPVNPVKHEVGEPAIESARPVPHANQISSYDFLTNFGKPGGGAPYKNTTRTTAGPSVLPNKPKITTRQTMTGPSVSAMDSSQVVDILFPARADTSNTSAISWKASPSNPNKIIIPRLSMEQLPPWEK